MKLIDSSQLIETLNWRYATKGFDASRKIRAQDWAALEEAVRLSPSSYGLQPWKFITVANPELRSKLRAASWDQAQVTDASHFLVFAVKTNLDEAEVDNYIQRIAEVRGVSLESLSGLRNSLNSNIVHGLSTEARTTWATRQVYIALGTFLASAAMLGIDACPMEGFEPAKYNDILGLTAQNLSAVVIAAAGYRSPGDKYASAPKVRFPTEDVFIQN